jgi:vacuolar-type H+-ATPase subunit E/Vma4
MSLYAILEAIRASGDSQVRKIESQAYVQCNQVLAGTRLEAEKVKAEAYTKAVTPAYKERARIMQRARLEAMRILGDARVKFVDSALVQIHTRLADTRSDPSYPHTLQHLLIEALAELEGSQSTPGTIQLEADPRDQAVLENILHEIGMDLSIEYSLECWGGLIAKSADGQVVAINTLEARLERAAPHLRRYLSALYENQGLDGEAIQDAEQQLEYI